uniref:Proline dehydrogenase n=1 Tax=Plectus sambesii TaxID=2011161 RepID=A0A914UIB5_9BILA
MLVSKALLQVAKNEKRLAVLVASMNKESVLKAVHLMKDLNLPPNHPLVSFGQIYGMGDPLSWFLGSSGYTVHKSTPWGPIDDWVPYLSRRAAENYSAFQTARNEIPLYRSQILSKMRSKRN